MGLVRGEKSKIRMDARHRRSDARAHGVRPRAIAEILVDDDRAGPLPALLFAVNMLVHSEHGDTFSLREITSWLRDAGFVNARTMEAPGLARRLILADKPQGIGMYA
jgi:hypothetical protein